MAVSAKKDLPAGGAWVLVAEDVLSATIQLITESNNPENFRKYAIETGGAAPVGKMDDETEVTNIHISVAHDEPIDVYMRYIGDNVNGGEVVVWS